MVVLNLVYELVVVVWKRERERERMDLEAE